MKARVEGVSLQARRVLGEAFASFAESAPVGIFVAEAGKFAFTNSAFMAITGYEASELLGRDCLSLVHVEDRERVRHLAIAMLKGFSRTPYEYRTVRKDGGLRWILESVASVRQPDGSRFSVGYFNDVTDAKRTEEELRSTLSLLVATLESTADGLLIVDAGGKIVSYNRRFVEMWRLPDEVVETKDDDKAIAFVLNQLSDPRGFVEKVRSLYSAPEAESYDVLDFIDGRVFERYSRPTRMDGRSVGRVWSFRDVTEQRRAEASLREQARRDSLTGVLNHAMIVAELRLLLESQPAARHAVLMADVRGMKAVNDSHGHLVGDEVIRLIARVLSAEEAIVGRYGGDEFVVVLPGADPATASDFRKRTTESLRSIPAEAGIPLGAIDLTLGVAHYPEDGLTAEKLLAAADAAMYRLRRPRAA